MNSDRLIEIARDLVILTVSAGGIVYQQLTGQYNAALITLYGTLLTGLMASKVRQLGRGPGTGSTDGDARSSPRARSSRSTRSSSSSQGADQ